MDAVSRSSWLSSRSVTSQLAETCTCIRCIRRAETTPKTCPVSVVKVATEAVE